jgi:hypothetical protein
MVRHSDKKDRTVDQDVKLIQDNSETKNYIYRLYESVSFKFVIKRLYYRLQMKRRKINVIDISMYLD